MLLYEDMLAETAKVEAAKQLAADGATALQRAVRDGAGGAEVARLLDAAPPAEADAALVVACAYHRDALVQELGAKLTQGAARVWYAAWERGASNDAVHEMGPATVAALVGAAAAVPGGVDACEADATALQRAAYGGHGRAVGALLGAGADVHLADSNGQTPLYLAAQKGHDAVVQVLLQVEGVAVNQAQETGVTPLFIAAEKGHEAVVQMLLQVEGGVEV